MINRAVENILGQKIRSCQHVGGGCIAQTRKIVTEKGDIFFLKSGVGVEMLKKEANGLREIEKSQSLEVPQVIAEAKDLLLLSYVEKGTPASDFFEKFGRKYALMHRYAASDFGFYEDNYIGNTVQLNVPHCEEKNDWPLFYFNKRLKFQISLIEKNGFLTSELSRLFSKLENRYSIILPNSNEEPALLHGDLWNGNFMVNRNGDPVIFDPAVYYGNREADLAMTKIFGGFPLEFYSAYNMSFPLSDGWEYREAIYRLYHMLNHLNLFGYSYY